jgi:hypothetical protein
MRSIIISSPKHGDHNVLVDDDDFDLINKYHWSLAKGKTTLYAHAYEWRNGRNHTIRMHKLVMGVASSTSGKRSLPIDHRDHNGLNNQKSNLRIASPAENARHARISKRNSSGYKGVCFHKGQQKFNARIRVDRKLIQIGSFDRAVDAASAYNDAALQYFGEFAVLNIV